LTKLKRRWRNLTNSGLNLIIEDLSSKLMLVKSILVIQCHRPYHLFQSSNCILSRIQRHNANQNIIR
jgi:hypothetical protein